MKRIHIFVLLTLSLIIISCGRSQEKLPTLVLHPHEEMPGNIDKKSYKSVFLAGTIDMGSSVDWQKDVADFILMNFLPDSKSPITLLELGLFARSGKLYVVCTEGFYRYDNVRITCAKYGVPVYDSLTDDMDKMAADAIFITIEVSLCHHLFFFAKINDGDRLGVTLFSEGVMKFSSQLPIGK